MNPTQTNPPAVRTRRGQRRTYIVDRAFQWKYTGMLVASVFLISALLSEVLYGVLLGQARARLVNPIPTHPWENTYSIVLAGLVFAIVPAAAMALGCIILTNRICGPLQIMRHQLLEIAKGRLPTKRAHRAKDEFKELHKAFWGAVETLRIKKQLEFDRLTEAIQSLKATAQDGGQQQTAQLKAVSAQLEVLRRDAAEALGADHTNPTSPTSAKPTPVRDTVGISA
ncbi:MAG: methyl-accepting chemotaxis protein [Planctomycetes bacterium]|nr:methyl-accepting chemotaxis protein [Planctomycetota bacterium]